MPGHRQIAQIDELKLIAQIKSSNLLSQASRKKNKIHSHSERKKLKDEHFGDDSLNKNISGLFYGLMVGSLCENNTKRIYKDHLMGLVELNEMNAYLFFLIKHTRPLDHLKEEVH